MVSTLVPGESGPGSSPGRGHCVVFLGKTLNTVPLSTQVYKWVRVNCWGKPNKLQGNDLRWTGILSRGSRNTPSRFMLQKPGISSGSYGPLRIERLHFGVTTILMW